VRLLIVIVNYRTAGLTIGALRSLEAEVGPLGARVVVVDGCSGDGSAEVLAEEVSRRGWSGWAGVMPLQENRGFAFGNNAAIRPAILEPDAPELVLLLNPDTVERAGALAALTAFLQTHPRVGIVGPRLEDLDATPQRSAFRFPTILGEFERGARLGPVSRVLQRWVVAPPVSEQPHRAECGPVMARGPMVPQRRPVGGRRISHILVPPIDRVAVGQPQHGPVADDLGHDRGGRDRERGPVAADHAFGRAGQVRWRAVAVHQRQVGRLPQPQHGAAHGQHGGMQDVELEDFGHGRGADPDLGATLVDRGKGLVALFGGELLGVVDQRRDPLRHP